MPGIVRSISMIKGVQVFNFVMSQVPKVKNRIIRQCPSRIVPAHLFMFCGLLMLIVPESVAQVQLTNAFPALSFTRPIFLTHAGDGTNRVFVAQQDGLIKVFPNDSAVTSSTVFLNITRKLSSTFGEEGLLGLAFHPDYENNGYFYIDYTAPNPLRTVIARYSVQQNDPNKADSLSELVILTINQPFSNHNGGMVMFGSDGYLYIGMGDGGSAGDPQNNGQNLQSLLGKILRIDVDTTAGGHNYGIPPTNPFAGNPTAGKEELFAWGMRNPWRFSEDITTNLMLLGDVGQDSWEEVDELQSGLNYGWRCYEGNAPYNTSGCGPISNYTFPIKVYSHSGGNCSVTGGYIYRGYRKPEFTGAYIYGDYCSGRVSLLRYENGNITADSLLIDAPFSLSSFGVDQDGELYLCNYGGNIQRFVGSPLIPSVPCDSIDQFQARCQPGGIIQARIILLNSTQYAGEEVTIGIDAVNYPVTIITNGIHSKAQIQLTGQTLDDHTISLVDPPGCFDPMTIACSRSVSKAGEDWFWDEDGTVASNVQTVVPVKTALLGNYPNPFNPTTVIKYELSSNVSVSLKLYDLLGREVMTLVDKPQTSGYYQVTLDASRLGNGVYFYRMIAGSFVQTRKVLLVK